MEFSVFIIMLPLIFVLIFLFIVTIYNKIIVRYLYSEKDFGRVLKEIKIPLEECELLRVDLVEEYSESLYIQRSQLKKINYSKACYVIRVKIDAEEYISTPYEMSKSEINYYLSQNKGVNVKIYQNGVAKFSFF